MSLLYVVLPASSLQTMNSYATQVDHALGLPSGVGTSAYTQTYVQPGTSFDGTQVSFLYDSVTQPIIDTAGELVAQPLLASWFPPESVWAVESGQVSQQTVKS